MPLRTDIEEFPFQNRDKSVWYFIIDWTNRTQKDYYNVQGKKELVEFLRTLIDNGDQQNNELFGVWNGHYSTDIFKIPIERGFNELSKYFSS